MDIGTHKLRITAGRRAAVAEKDQGAHQVELVGKQIDREPEPSKNELDIFRGEGSPTTKEILSLTKISEGNTGRRLPAVPFRIPVRNFLSKTFEKGKEKLKESEKLNFLSCSGPGDSGPEHVNPRIIPPKNSSLEGEPSQPTDNSRKSPVSIPGDRLFEGVGTKTPGNLEFFTDKLDNTNLKNSFNDSTNDRNICQGSARDFPQVGMENQVPGNSLVPPK